MNKHYTIENYDNYSNTATSKDSPAKEKRKWFPKLATMTTFNSMHTYSDNPRNNAFSPATCQVQKQNKPNGKHAYLTYIPGIEYPVSSMSEAPNHVPPVYHTVPDTIYLTRDIWYCCVLVYTVMVPTANK